MYVEVSVTGGVPTEQSGLVAVIHGQPVAVAQPEVAVLVPDGSVAVAVALVVHSHPVGTVGPVSYDALGSNEFHIIVLKCRSFFWMPSVYQ